MLEERYGLFSGSIVESGVDVESTGSAQSFVQAIRVVPTPVSTKSHKHHGEDPRGGEQHTVFLTGHPVDGVQ